MSDTFNDAPPRVLVARLAEQGAETICVNWEHIDHCTCTPTLVGWERRAFHARLTGNNHADYRRTLNRGERHIASHDLARAARDYNSTGNVEDVDIFTPRRLSLKAEY